MGRYSVPLRENKMIKLQMRVKDLNIKSLQTGDKQAWLKLETVSEADVVSLAPLAGETFVTVVIFLEEETGGNDDQEELYY